MENESVKSRLIEFINSQNMTVRRFESECNLPQSTVAHIGERVSDKIVSKIIKRFPLFNYHWLATGEGTSLVSETLELNDAERAAYKKAISYRDARIMELENENFVLNQILEQVKKKYPDCINDKK